MAQPTNLQLRPAQQGDYDSLWRLHRVALRPYVEAIWGWDEEWQAEHFQTHFDPTSQQVVIYRGQEVGTIKVEDHADHVFLGYIAILPEFQGQGIGTALIEDVLALARERGLPVTLRVLQGNPARRLYERLGFTVTKETDERASMIHP